MHQKFVSSMLNAGAHPSWLFGYHDRPLYTTGRLLSIKAVDKISNAVTVGLWYRWGGLVQATACISLLKLHSTISKQQRPCLVYMAPAQWHETIHVFEHFEIILRRTQVFWNFLLWKWQLQCKECCQKLLHCHGQLFCNISLHGERSVQSRLFCSFGLSFIYCLHLLDYD